MKGWRGEELGVLDLESGCRVQWSTMRGCEGLRFRVNPKP